MPKCTRKGCGREFSDSEDASEPCTFHPGNAVFHEGLKSWSCCSEVYKPVLEFEQFMKIPGCAQTERHTTEVPRTEAPKPAPSANLTMTTGESTGQEIYSSTPIKPIPKLKTTTEAGAKPTPPPPVLEEDDDLSIPVAAGTKCKRNGCNAAFVSDEVSRVGDGEGLSATIIRSLLFSMKGAKYVFCLNWYCRYQRAQGYLCCKRRVLEFDEFLKIGGCKTGRHLFAAKAVEPETEQLTTCRIDHYQTLDMVHVSIFAKQADKERSRVKFEETQISFDIYLPGSKRFSKTVELFGPIEPDASSFAFFGTKVELNLKKQDNRSWTILERSTDGKFDQINFTFGVGGRTGTQPQSPSANDIQQADIVAAARNKWATKPSPAAGPIPSTSSAVHPPVPFRRIYSNIDFKLVWYIKPPPVAASSSSRSEGAKVSTTSKWALPPRHSSREPEPSTGAAPRTVLADPGRRTPAANTTRPRWPSLNSNALSSDPEMPAAQEPKPSESRSRWTLPPAESPAALRRATSQTRSRTSVQASTPQPAQSDSHALPPHLKWTRPQTVASPSAHPIDSTSVVDTIDRLLPQIPSNTPPSPEARASSPPRTTSTEIHRDNAPHLNSSFVHAHEKQVRSQEKAAIRTQTRTQIDRQTRPTPSRSPQSEMQVPSNAPPTGNITTGDIGETELKERHHNRSKTSYKERGSLLRGDLRGEALMPTVDTKTTQPKVKKAFSFVEKRVDEDVFIPSTVSVGHLARLLNVRLEDLQDKMFQSGMGEQTSFDYVLTSDYAVLLAEEFGRKPTVNDEAAFDLFPPPPHPNPELLPNRPPVVTIMGHVDHGKTTLLDSLRSASVAAGEVGGITQHIGAFSVPVPSSQAGGPQSITFLDTPGHAAFSAMRARGAQVTDIIVLVVAADDGLMPQTREVIELIKKDRDKVGVVVAINKIDKPGCDVDALQKALLVEDIHLEELGGDVPSVEVSGLTGQGLPDLVDTISLISEIQDLRAETDGKVFGYVLESKVVKGLGPVATVLVLLRIMHDSNNKVVKTASPGIAVIVSGWKSLPSAGDEVLQGSESEIKRVIVNRQRKADIEASLLDVEAINASRQQERDQVKIEHAKEEELGGPKELRLLIKADVNGSAEAVEGALQGIGNHLAMTKVISSGVGAIAESDVMMAKAVGGTIVGFSVSASRAVELLANQNDVPILTSDIIYRLMEDVRTRVIALLPTTTEYRVLGEAKVLELFQVTVKGKKLKTIAGSRVTNGLVEKSKLARVVRNGEVVFEGSFETMRHFKKDVSELRKGTECGLNLAGFDELAVDDLIQAYETVQIPGVL
ncbi:translation initiation factor IF-2 [Favolaschia claudopus]|uniref:Translation initiation factor IF-2, mitochondrial n=1 Tax=Favolaschia claudopus TaxID=2862362 RepID=A0AAW0BDX3_9AGAR